MAMREIKGKKPQILHAAGLMDFFHSPHYFLKRYQENKES